MVNHFSISHSAFQLARDATMAHAAMVNRDTYMVDLHSLSALEELKKIAAEFGYSLEKITAPALRAA